MGTHLRYFSVVLKNISGWREIPWCISCEPKGKKVATCWEIPMCTVCSESSSLTKLLGKLQPWKYLRQNLSSCGKGLSIVLKETLSPLSSFLPRTAVVFDLKYVSYFSVFLKDPLWLQFSLFLWKDLLLVICGKVFLEILFPALSLLISRKLQEW